MNFIEDVRDKLNIMDILKGIVMRAEFMPEEMDTLREYNSIKAILNGCAVDSGKQRVIMLEVMDSILDEMKIKNRIQKISVADETLFSKEPTSALDRAAVATKKKQHLQDFFKLSMRKAFRAIFEETGYNTNGTGGDPKKELLEQFVQFM